MAKETVLNFEAQLFKAADKLRKNIDAAEYKNVVLGLVFLKHISDTFQDFPINLLLFFRQLPVIVFFCVLFCRFGYFLIRNLFLFIGNKLFHIYVSDSLCCRDPYE